MNESIIKSNRIVTFTANAIYGIITFLLLLFPKEMLAFDPIYKQIMITYFGFSAWMLLVSSILSFTEITVEFQKPPQKGKDNAGNGRASFFLIDCK